VVFDNVKKTIKIIVSAILEDKKDIKQVYTETVNRINSIEEKLCREIKLKRIPVIDLKSVDIKDWKSNFKKKSLKQTLLMFTGLSDP